MAQDPRKPPSTPPGHGGTPPGQGGTPPGQAGRPPQQPELPEQPPRPGTPTPPERPQPGLPPRPGGGPMPGRPTRPGGGPMPGGPEVSPGPVPPGSGGTPVPPEPPIDVPPTEPPGTEPPSGVTIPENPNAPPNPPIPSVLPGSSGRTIKAGAGGEFTSVKDAVENQAKDGDTVIIQPNTPRETFVILTNILLDGGNNVWDFSDLAASDLTWDKAAIVAHSPAWHIRHLEISGAGIRETTHSLVAAVRCDNPSYGLIEGCKFHNNQVGFAADQGMPWVIELRDTTLEHNGLGDGLTHNLYVNDGNRITLTRCVSTDPNVSHALKSRAYVTVIVDSDLDATDGSCLNLPDAGAFVIHNTVMHKPTGSADHKLLTYGDEGSGRGFSDNAITAGTVETLCDNPFIVCNGGSINFAGTTFSGNKVTAQGGGTVTGLP